MLIGLLSHSCSAVAVIGWTLSMRAVVFCALLVIWCTVVELLNDSGQGVLM